MASVAHQTPRCISCGEYSVLVLPQDDLAAWQGGRLVQRAFPYLTTDERELLITGTHAECWDQMFPSLDHDEDDAWGDEHWEVE